MLEIFDKRHEIANTNYPHERKNFLEAETPAHYETGVSHRKERKVLILGVCRIAVLRTLSREKTAV